VSDEEVWETVKRLRKVRWLQLCKENGCTHRFVQWMLAKRRPTHTETVENRNSTTSMGSTSSEDVDLESPRVTHSEQQEIVDQSRDIQGHGEVALSSTNEEVCRK
jgi:hypothetical protein